MLTAILIICGVSMAWGQLPRTAGFHDKYTLSGVVVMSRHNIRSPLTSGAVQHICE